MTKYLKIAPDPDAKPCRCGDGNPDCEHFDFCPECGEEYKEHEAHDCIDGVPVQDLRALAKELRDSLDACETERDRLRAQIAALQAEDRRVGPDEVVVPRSATEYAVRAFDWIDCPDPEHYEALRSFHDALRTSAQAHNGEESK